MDEHATPGAPQPSVWQVRPARADDLAEIVALVRELAAYERAANEVRLDVAALERALFGPDPVAFCHVAALDSGLIGFALFFRTFSTWTGRAGIWLEDLYVRPQARGRGVGRALLSSLAERACAAGMARIEWAVLDWNTPAWQFYARLGAEPMQEWTTHRLSGEALNALGTRDAAGPRP